VSAPKKRGLWQRVWGFDSRHPLPWDLTPPIVVGLIASAVALVAEPGATEPTWSPNWIELPLIAATVAPLAWRRRRPLALALYLNLPALAHTFLDLGNESGASAALGIAWVIALFNVALRCRPSHLWLVAGLAALGGTIGYAANEDDPSLLGYVGMLVETAVAFLLVALIGLVMRTRRDYQSSERERMAQTAVTEERARIAREMHDIIGHNLAVVNALADGGAYAARTDPDRARVALEAIGSTSRQALAELRRVLAVLRAEDGDDADLAPQPGLSELDTLIDRVREAGLPVTVRRSGEPWALSEGQQLVVYRTVQEALTNVLKHAAGLPHAEVALAYDDAGLAVQVTDSGALAVAGKAERGLFGLRERAAAFGGTMEAGPLPTGGWRVRLRLPRDKDGDS
jgi:signal transduction histidine kinase